MADSQTPTPVITDAQIAQTATMVDSFKGAFKSKTIWTSFVIAAVSVGQAYLPAVLPYLTQSNTMYGGLGIAVAMTMLRIVTTQPLSGK